MSSVRALVSSALLALLPALGASACSTEEDADGVTFAQAIEPLVQEKCQRCHREGGIAPFALVTYEDVKRMGQLAKEKVVAREMPPWGAFDDEKCQMRHKIKDDLRLTDEQIDTFARWVDKGMPRGDDAKRPPPKTFPPDGLATKTHTLAIAKPYEVLADGTDDIRCFPIDPGFTEDAWIAATNVKPGNPSVVHHVIVYLDPNKQGTAKAAEAGSYPCFGGPEVDDTGLLLAWAPGVPPWTYGEDAGIKVPAGSHLVMQVHYHPGAATTTDQSAFELQVLPYRPGYVVDITLAGNAESARGRFIKLLPGPNDPPSGPEFVIPSNVAGHTESMELTMPATIGGVEIPPLSLAAAGAHMHWAGVDMKIEIERAVPDEKQPEHECLLGTPKYDFNWQRGYQYDAAFDDLPVIKPGDKLRFTCTYDNTPNNEHVRRAMSEMRLSSPPTIRLGEQTFDEMCLGVLVTLRRAQLVEP